MKISISTLFSPLISDWAEGSVHLIVAGTGFRLKDANVLITSALFKNSGSHRNVVKFGGFYEEEILRSYLIFFFGNIGEKWNEEDFQLIFKNLKGN